MGGRYPCGLSDLMWPERIDSPGEAFGYIGVSASVTVSELIEES